MCRLKFTRYSCKCVSAIPVIDTICEASRSQAGRPVGGGATCTVVNFEVKSTYECPEHRVENMHKRAELQRMKEQVEKGTWLDRCLAEVKRSREEKRKRVKEAEKRDVLDGESVEHGEVAEPKSTTDG